MTGCTSNRKKRHSSGTCPSPYAQEGSLLYWKASLTVEAAIVLPMFLVALIMAFEALDVYRLHSMLVVSLEESARILSVYGNAIGQDGEEHYEVPETAVCIAYAKTQIPEEVKNKGTLTFTGSRIERDVLHLKAIYWPHVGNRLLPVQIFGVAAEARVHLFNGYSGEEDEDDHGTEEMVYVTDYESVYHTSASCSHIHLSIYEVSKEQADKRRNQDGEKYYPCEKCVGKGEAAENVYLSAYGNRYHNSLECSGLKRSVHLVPKEEAEGLRLCSKCARETDSSE